MKRLATVAFIVAGMISAACAQRGGSHGGFSGHSAPPAHGGFGGSAPAFHGSFSAPSRPASSQRYGPTSRPLVNAQGSARSSYPGRSDHRMPYHPRHDRDNRYGWGIPYAYSGFPGWYNPYYPGYPGFMDYGDYGDNQDSSAPQNYDSQGYAPQDNSPQGGQAQGEYEGRPEPPPWPSYNPPQPVAAQLPVESVTLVFNDGNPPEQIRNYILTPAALYIFDNHRREVPIGHIDLAATAKANHDAGVDFNLPGVAR